MRADITGADIHFNNNSMMSSNEEVVTHLIQVMTSRRQLSQDFHQNIDLIAIVFTSEQIMSSVMGLKSITSEDMPPMADNHFNNHFSSFVSRSGLMSDAFSSVNTLLKPKNRENIKN